MSVVWPSHHITTPVPWLNHHPTLRSSMKRSLFSHPPSSSSTDLLDPPPCSASKRFASERVVTRNLGRLSLSPPVDISSPDDPTSRAEVILTDDSVEFEERSESKQQLVLTDTIRQQWGTESPSLVLAPSTDPVLARLMESGALQGPPPRPLAPPDPSQALVVWRPLPLQGVFSEADDNEGSNQSDPIPPESQATALCPHHFSTQLRSDAIPSQKLPPVPAFNPLDDPDICMDVTMQ